MAGQTGADLEQLNLATICQSGRCPNRDECFSERCAAFMILGRVCTRHCAFCAVDKGLPETVDANEPERVALAAAKLGLSHVVVTSVTRDDLADEGCSQFVRVIGALKKAKDSATIEVLTPDFRRIAASASKELVNAGPDIFNHNLETVPRLYQRVRPEADYAASLEILRLVREESQDSILTKSGLMLGLGENFTEVLAVLSDLRRVGCSLLTLGQYLKPREGCIDVEEYVHPDLFRRYRDEALAMGFRYVAAGPFVRSSFHAKEVLELLSKKV